MKYLHRFWKRTKKIFFRLKPKPTSPLPVVHTSYHQLTTQTQKQFLLGFLIFLAFGLYSLSQYRTQTKAANELIEVAVINTDLNAPITLELSHLEIVSIPAKYLPSDHIKVADIKDFIGQTVKHDLSENQILTATQVSPDLNPNSISAKFTERFAFSVDEGWLVAKLPSLKANDRVNILVSNPSISEDSTTTLLSETPVIEVTKSGSKKSVVLNLSETESQSLLLARSLRLPMQVIVLSAKPPNESATTLEK